MFALAPVSLWLEDYSGLRQLFAAGASRRDDLRAHLLDDPRRVKECSALIKVLKVNRATLALFEAPTSSISSPTSRVFRDDMLKPTSRSWCSSGTARPASPATPSTTRSRRAARHPAQGAILPGHERHWIAC
jgi:hypothetical protein